MLQQWQSSKKGTRGWIYVWSFRSYHMDVASKQWTISMCVTTQKQLRRKRRWSAYISIHDENRSRFNSIMTWIVRFGTRFRLSFQDFMPTSLALLRDPINRGSAKKTPFNRNRPVAPNQSWHEGNSKVWWGWYGEVKQKLTVYAYSLMILLCNGLSIFITLPLALQSFRAEQQQLGPSLYIQQVCIHLPPA